MPSSCLGAPSMDFSRRYGFPHASTGRILAINLALSGGMSVQMFLQLFGTAREQ